MVPILICCSLAVRFWLVRVKACMFLKMNVDPLLRDVQTHLRMVTSFLYKVMEVNCLQTQAKGCTIREMKVEVGLRDNI